MDRRAQLRELWGLEFPDELFEWWTWYRALSDAERHVLADDAHMSPGGVTDVLAGKFDGVELRYPAVLHWRFRLDHPEFVTVLTGDTDGLHWGYWFDAPNIAPVIVSNYARDAYEFSVVGSSLFGLTGDQIERSLDDNEEWLGTAKGDYVASYRKRIGDLKALGAKLPRGAPAARAKRTPTRTTTEGMGIIVPRETWDARLALEPLAADGALARCEQWIAAGKAGVALYHAKQLWPQHHDVACRIMERAYAALGREALAAIARAHREHPGLPSVDVLGYKRGDFIGHAAASADPLAVKKLDLNGQRLVALPDLAAMTQLEELQIANNQLATLPAQLASCIAVRKINAWRNQLVGFPAVLAELPALVELNLGHNRIATIDGDVLRRCRALESLDLVNNKLVALPDAIGELPALTSLNLANLPLETLPASLGTAKLIYLALGATKLTELPADLSGWRDMKRLSLVGAPLPAEEVERARAAAPNAQVIAPK